MGAPARRATPDDSNRNRASRRPGSGLSPLSAALLITGLIGGLLLIVADFTTLLDVRAVTVVLEERTGGEHHSYALVPIGIGAVLMALGASTGRSRPAQFALLGLAAIAALIVFVGDLPDVNKTGYTQRFESADASPKRGFYLETLGVALLFISAVGNLLLNAPRPEPRRRRPRPPQPVEPDASPSPGE